jgi:glyoxylase-like metal-dependent hydrolase (beta-lactamase superfamily II)
MSERIERIRLGDLSLYFLRDGAFWPDAGSIFGPVPKALWGKVCPPDDRNRMELAINPVLIDSESGWILIDPGIGDKYDEKWRKIYNIDRSSTLDHSLTELGIKLSEISIVILTHLHFDHAGACTRLDEAGKLAPSFPDARHFVQRREWDGARSPNERTRTAYLSDDFAPLGENELVELIDGDCEVTPGVRVQLTGGHTSGHQIVLIESGGSTAVVCSDILPTTFHTPLAYATAFDVRPQETLEAKRTIYGHAIGENWLVIPAHDLSIKAGYLREAGGRLSLERYDGVQS